MCDRLSAYSKALMMIRKISLSSILVLTLGACTGDGDGDSFATLTSGPTTFTNGNTNGDGDGDPAETDGDGDGDPADSGDGDGDSGDGDGDSGDGDGDSGDGDGDSGDGDGDSGDGDGDPQTSCGWDGVQYYICGGSGSDPGGTNPIECPPGLVENAPCGELTGAGCCDDNGDNWFCGEDDQMMTFVVKDDCP
jgi:hypothetical protein